MSLVSSANRQTFNSPFETGLRSICILASNVELSLDLQQLSAFDHMVVHTGDFGEAPESLHPENPQRNGELVIRRELVERGLQLMESKNLVVKSATPNGFTYTATELAAVLLDSLTTPYIVQLRQRASWIIGNYLSYEDDAFPLVFNKAFDRWTTEFQFEQLTMATK